MATLTLPNTFVASTLAKSAEVNANFAAVKSFVEGSLLHKDGTVALTALLNSNGATPTAGTHLCDKTYVDSIKTKITLADESSDTTCFPVFANTATGDQAMKTDASRLKYNASTGDLEATLFSGSGASLTNLPAAQLTGTINNARLPSAISVTSVTGTSMVESNGTLYVGSGSIESGRNFEVESEAGDFAAIYRKTTNTANSILLLESNVGATQGDKFRCYANGNVETTTGSYGTISDPRLKDILGPSAPQLEKLRALKVIDYRLIKGATPDGKLVDLDEPSEKLKGFDAAQVQQVAPGLVQVNERGIRSVKTTVLIPMLVKAVQELAEAIEAR